MYPETATSTAHGQQAFATLQNLYDLYRTPSTATGPARSTLPPTTATRLASPSTTASTVLYLAYGSNLSAETFLGVRGIKPISSRTVHVPTLTLTFDLAGIPYKEPCFANSAWRNPLPRPPNPMPQPPFTDDYHKDRWQKGLIGVVYEVTLADYAKIIATEGGGASYEDVIVPCFPIAKGIKTVDPFPRVVPFMAHTLLCPELEPRTTTGGRIRRPDPSYAQPSARYLKLITDGAEEHELPNEYIAYLYNIRPYTITTRKQEIGTVIFTGFWFPIIIALFGLGKMLADDKGILPWWFANISGLVFRLVWVSYDIFFKRVFGDGERTMEGNGDDEEIGDRGWTEKRRDTHWGEMKKGDIFLQ